MPRRATPLPRHILQIPLWTARSLNAPEKAILACTLVRRLRFALFPPRKYQSRRLPFSSGLQDNPDASSACGSRRGSGERGSPDDLHLPSSRSV